MILLVGVGFVSLVFGSKSVPIISGDDAAYGATVVYSMAPVLTAVVALGMLESRLSRWERLAVRPLTWPRLAWALLSAMSALAVLLPAATREPTAHPVESAVQSLTSCFALGVFVGLRAGYEWQVVTVATYGVLSAMVTPSLAHPSLLLLVGAFTQERLAVAISLFVLAIAAHAVARPRVN